MSRYSNFRGAIIDLCEEFRLPKPKNVMDLMKLCEHIIFQGQLEFTEEYIKELHIKVKLEDGNSYEILEDGVDEE